MIVTEGVTNATCATATGGPFNRLTLKLATQQNAAANFASIRIYGCKIWEKEKGEYVLKRDYVPAVESGVAGLRDATLADSDFRSGSGTSPLTYGGAFTPTVTQTAAKLYVGESATLSASASGAMSYRWFRNGAEIPGESASSLVVRWRRGGGADTYVVKAAYVVDGATIESAVSESMAVENAPAGLGIVIR